MSSFVRSELKNLRRKKRKLENRKQGESSSTARISLMEENGEATGTHSTVESAVRKPLRPSSSKDQIPSSTSEDEDDVSDESSSGGGSTDGEEGNSPISKLDFVNLNNTNISYCGKPDPLRELVQNVKTDILRNYPDTPEFGKTVRKFSSLTKENLLISYDLEDIRQSSRHHLPAKICLEENILEEIRSNIGTAEEADRDLDHTDLFGRQWFPAVEMFLYTAVSLIKRILYPAEDDESVRQAREIIRGKRRKRTGKERRRTGRSTEESEPSGNIYLHLCSVFGRIFSLEHCEVDKRTFVVGDRVVNSAPDLVYSLVRMPHAGNNLQTSTLLSVMEVKMYHGRYVSSDCLEEQVDCGALEQVGCELFAEAFYSVLYPNSLGIICMETKLIFVYLKMPREHLNSICFKQPLTTEGKIHYTRPYDMLKAEDRAEVCEFLYWLGCFQNHGRQSLMCT